MNRCPECDGRLMRDESYSDSRPSGLGPYGAEETYVVTVIACRDCGYTTEETR